LRSVLYAEYPHLAMIDHIEAGDPADVKKLANASGSVEKTAFVSPVKDFYLTNPIARASAVMAECSALAKSGFKQAAE
jgi:NADH-quinone oxidoreductase subunit G